MATYEVVEIDRMKFKDIYPDFATWQNTVITNVNGLVPFDAAFLDDTKMYFTQANVYNAFLNKYGEYYAVNTEDDTTKLIANAMVQNLPALYVKTTKLKNQFMDQFNSLELLDILTEWKNDDPDNNYKETDNSYSSTPDSSNDAPFALTGVKEKNMNRVKDKTIRQKRLTDIIARFNQIEYTKVNGQLGAFINSIEFASLFEILTTDEVIQNIVVVGDGGGSATFATGENVEDISITSLGEQALALWSAEYSQSIIDGLNNGLTLLQAQINANAQQIQLNSQSIQFLTILTNELNNAINVNTVAIQAIIDALADYQWIPETPVPLAFTGADGFATYDPNDPVGLPVFTNGDVVYVKFQDTTTGIAEFHIESWNDGSATDIDFFGDPQCFLQTFTDHTEVLNVGGANNRLDKVLISISRTGSGVVDDPNKANVNLDNVQGADMKLKGTESGLTAQDDVRYIFLMPFEDADAFVAGIKEGQIIETFIDVRDADDNVSNRKVFIEVDIHTPTYAILTGHYVDPNPISLEATKIEIKGTIRTTDPTIELQEVVQMVVDGLTFELSEQIFTTFTYSSQEYLPNTKVIFRRAPTVASLSASGIINLMENTVSSNASTNYSFPNSTSTTNSIIAQHIGSLNTSGNANKIRTQGVGLEIWKEV